MMPFIVALLTGTFTLCGIAVTAFLKLIYDLKVEGRKNELQVQVEELKTQLATEKDKNHYQYTKLFDIQVASIAELARKENLLHQSLYVFVNNWELYLKLEFNQEEPNTLARDKAHTKVLDAHDEFIDEYASDKYFLTNDLDKLYLEIIDVYQSILRAIDLTIIRKYDNGKFENKPFGKEELEFLRQYWSEILNMIKVDIQNKNRELKRKIQEFMIPKYLTS